MFLVKNIFWRNIMLKTTLLLNTIDNVRDFVEIANSKNYDK
jgi:hypothetical protein